MCERKCIQAGCGKYQYKEGIVMNIIVNGHSFYEVEAKEVNNKEYKLLESEVYGEDYCIIVDNNNNFVMTSCNGFLDLEEALEEEAYKELKSEVVKSISFKTDAYYFNMYVNGLNEAVLHLKVFATAKYKYDVNFSRSSNDFLQGVANLYEDGTLEAYEVVQAIEAYVNDNAVAILYGNYGVAIHGSYDDVIVFFKK